MAWFSKEYCAKHMFWQNEMEKAIEFSDFSIEEEIKDLLPWNYIDIICEGYWFNWISRWIDWNIYFLYGDWFDKSLCWEEMLDKYEQNGYNEEYFVPVPLDVENN